ncbi:hypothetical protein CT19431_30082 [Cupriavidus taiwanensis]|nr:hypothetical protein CT19431_30082 [Cupriavidus taiwanensis]
MTPEHPTSFSPLPLAGEGSKQADHDQRIHPMTTPALTQPKGNPCSPARILRARLRPRATAFAITL